MTDEHEALQALLRPSGLILGVDGRVHYGNVLRKFSATIMDGIVCGQVALRPIGPREQWWRRDTWRACSVCGTDDGAA